MNSTVASPRHRPRSRRPLAALALSVVATSLVGCSDERDGGAAPLAPQSSSIVPAPGYEPPPFDELPTLFADRLPPLTEAAEAQMAAVDPAVGGWPTEVAATRIQERLERLFTAFVRSPIDPQVLDAVAAAELPGLPRLVPTETRSDYDDGLLSVTTGTAFDPAPLDPDAAAETFREGLVPGPATFDVRVVSIAPRSVDDAGSADGFATRARLRFALRGKVRVQRDLVLASTWTGTAEDPQLASLTVESWQDARSTRRPFVDVTRAVFGHNRRYGDLMRGVEAYFGRIDPQIGTSFQGMQGLAIGDVNGDGLEDLYVCQQAGLPDQLLIKNPDGRADDCAQPAFVNWLDTSRTTLIVDLDNDGHQDLVQALGRFIAVSYNDGTGKYPPPTTLAADGEAQFYSLSAADADNDGDLDLFAGRYALEGVMHGVPTPYYDARNGSSNYFWLNEGRNAFTDATDASGLGVANDRFTLASIWEDFDEDGDMDLYVVNDFGSNQLFENDGSAHFEDVAGELGLVDIGAGMGASIADFDRDGDLDVYVTNMWTAAGQRVAEQHDRFLGGSQPELLQWYSKHASGNALLVNDGSGRFQDRAADLGATIGYWGWGGRFCDLNGDGFDDLYVPCGQTTHPRSELDLEAFFWHGVISQSPEAPPAGDGYRDAFGAIHHMVMHEPYSWNGSEPNVAYLNLGGDRFVDVSFATRLDFVEDGRAVATVDWDEDGREDLVVKSRTAPRLRLLLNRWRQDGAWIAFELQGTTANRDAIGARVRIESDGRVQQKRVYAGDGYLCQSSKRLTFALGDVETVDVTVQWPGGSEERFSGLEAGRRHRLVQGQAEAEALEPVAALTRSLAAARPAPPKADPRPVTRIVPVMRLPIAPFPVPSVDQPNRKLADFVGQPVLIHLFTAAHPSGEAGLKELQASKAELESIGTRVVCLSVDEGPDLAKARELVAAAGLEEDFGYADGATLAAYELVVFEVAGPFERIPVPLSFLCDPGGLLVAMYVGLPYGRELREDLPKVARLRPDRPTTIALTGGKLLYTRARRFGLLAKGYRAIGHPELAAFFESITLPPEAGAPPGSAPPGGPQPLGPGVEPAGGPGPGGR